MDEYGINLQEFLENIDLETKIRVMNNDNCIFDGCVKDISEDKSSKYCVLLQKTVLTDTRVEIWVEHEEEVNRRRRAEREAYRNSENGKKEVVERLKDRIHIIEAIVWAQAHWREVAEVIYSSANSSEAKRRLIEAYHFDEAQVQAVVDMRMRGICQYEREKLGEELHISCEIWREQV